MSKMNLYAGAVLAAVATAGGSAEGALRLYDSFPYSAGVLVGQAVPAGTTSAGNVWGHGASGSANDFATNPLVDLPYAPLIQSGPDGSANGGGAGSQPRVAITLAFFNTGSPVNVYFSYLVRVDNLAGTASGPLGAGGLISGLNNGINSQAGTMNTYGASVYARLDGSPGGTFNFGILEQGVDGTQATYDATPRALGTTYLIVGRYQINGTVNTGGATPTTDDNIQFWINPVTLGGADPAGAVVAVNPRTDIPTPSANPANATVQSFSFRQDGGSVLSATAYVVDDLRVGDTFADVTPTPEPAGLAMLGLAGASFLARRRRL